MIEPWRSGAELLEIIDAPVEVDQVRLVRLGQSGVALRFPRAVVFVDLYLSNHCEAVLPRPFDHRRMTRAPLDPAEITIADLVLCTHDHLDHLDPPTVRTLTTSSPSSVLVLPEAAEPVAASLDWPESRRRPMRGHDHVEAAGLRVDGFPVQHESFDHDDSTGFPYLGFAVTDGATTVVHVGDALAGEDLARRLSSYRPDVLLLPVNGRDEERRRLGFAGNMTADEALDLADGCGASLVVPMHYDMFVQNVDAGALQTFVAGARRRGTPTRVLPVGEPLVVAGGSRP